MAVTAVRETWELRQQADASQRMRGHVPEQLADAFAAARRATQGDVYRLPAADTPKLVKAAVRAGKNALGLGLTPLDGEVVADEQGLGVAWLFARLSGPPVQVDGQQIVARLDAFGAGSLLRAVPGAEAPVDGSPWRAQPPMCGRCGSRRRRKDAFLLARDGELEQVARCCLAEHAAQLKHADTAIAFALKLEQVEIDAEQAPPAERLLPAHRYLSFVACSIRESGWVKRSGMVQHGHYMPPTQNATADVAHRWLMASTADRRDEHDRPLYTLPAAEDEQRAADAISYVRANLRADQGSEYERKLAGALDGDWISERDLGVAASAFVSMDRAADKQSRRDALSGNGFVGKVGEKFNVAVTVHGAWPRRSQYGGMTYKLLDAEGNLLTWFASEAAAELTRGRSYVLGVTVKDHEVYQGVKQTIVTRCQVQQEIV